MTSRPLRDEHVQVAGRLPQVKTSRATKTLAQPTMMDADQMLPFEKAGDSEASPARSNTSSEEANARPSRHRWRRRRRATPREQRTQAPLPPSDVVHLADLLAPASIEEFRDAIRVGGREEEWVRGIAVTAFPREVSTTGWLAPLLLHDDVLEVVFHIHPQDSTRVLRQLKRQRTGYAATKAFNRRYGRLDEPEMEVAQADVQHLMSRLASGEERLFEVSLFLLVRGSDRLTLDERSERVMALLQTVFLDAVAHPTTYAHGLALQSALPECRDQLSRTITLDGSSLATTFPFISNSLSMPGGALLGITESGNRCCLIPGIPAWRTRISGLVARPAPGNRRPVKPCWSVSCSS